MDFSWLTDWLVGILRWFGQAIYNGTIKLVNAVIAALAAFVDMVLALLPTTSFDTPGSVASEWLGTMNWFLPINHIVFSLGMYSTALLIYFGTGPILRWLKVIR
ncbi:MAG: hypothetical protein L6364_04050 [Desulfobulbaceae bacterium]|jgi:uncharacterized membrane protein|nr:hypothetical protein [Pseudomonadota bacterium]MCG2822845.1 hypothetical protein [Desulfobulbaceae bacterium]